MSLKVENVRQVKCFGEVVYEEFCKQQAIPFKEWAQLSVETQKHWDASAKAGVEYAFKLVQEQQELAAKSEQQAREALAQDTVEIDGGNVDRGADSGAQSHAQESVVDPAKKQDGSGASSADRPEPKTLGEINYNAYYDNVGGIAVTNGQPLPAWADVLPKAKDGWEFGAGAVALQILNDLASAKSAEQVLDARAGACGGGGAGFSVTGKKG